MSFNNPTPYSGFAPADVYSQPIATHAQYDTLIIDQLNRAIFDIETQRHYLQTRISLEAQRKAIDKQLDMTPLMGPTPNELQQHESLRNAWSEYQFVRKLVGAGV